MNLEELNAKLIETIKKSQTKKQRTRKRITKWQKLIAIFCLIY